MSASAWHLAPAHSELLPNVLSYAELASSSPVAAGGYAYISEALRGVLPFTVGWVSWFSSLVYSALAAVGAAYSLKLFLPFFPVKMTALVLIALLRMKKPDR